MTDIEEEPALHTMSAADCIQALDRGPVAVLRGTHPIRAQVAASLMLADAASARLWLPWAERIVKAEGLSYLKRDPAAFYEPLRLFEHFRDALTEAEKEWTAHAKKLDALSRFMTEGTPSRIDLVMWDAQGFVFGWFLGENGELDTNVSCPEAVAYN